MSYCEDYPCCGHTAENPCERQWYDEPDAFDLSKNPHAFCDHENGECEVWYDEDDAHCPDCGMDYYDSECVHGECPECCSYCSREHAIEARDNAYVWGDA